MGAFNPDPENAQPSVLMLLHDALLWHLQGLSLLGMQVCVGGGACCMIKARFHPWFAPRIWIVTRVLDLDLMCVPRNKTQDPTCNIGRRQRVEFPRRVLSQCYVFLWTCGNKWMLQWWNMHTVQSILPMRCQSCWTRSTNVEQNQLHCNSHEFLICAKSHLFFWWNIRETLF